MWRDGAGPIRKRGLVGPGAFAGAVTKVSHLKVGSSREYLTIATSLVSDPYRGISLVPSKVLGRCDVGSCTPPTSSRLRSVTKHLQALRSGRGLSIHVEHAVALI